MVLAFYAPFVSQAQATDVVTTYKDENGWKLQGQPTRVFLLTGVEGKTRYDWSATEGALPVPQTAVAAAYDSPHKFPLSLLEGLHGHSRNAPRMWGGRDGKAKQGSLLRTPSGETSLSAAGRHHN